jgi:hypothetical protein
MAFKARWQKGPRGSGPGGIPLIDPSHYEPPTGCNCLVRRDQNRLKPASSPVGAQPVQRSPATTPATSGTATERGQYEEGERICGIEATLHRAGVYYPIIPLRKDEQSEVVTGVGLSPAAGSRQIRQRQREKLIMGTLVRALLEDASFDIRIAA